MKKDGIIISSLPQIISQLAHFSEKKSRITRVDTGDILLIYHVKKALRSLVFYDL